MVEVLYAAEMWLLLAALFTWFLARAALTLRQPPPTRAELLVAAKPRSDEAGALETGLERGALWRAVRVYERA
jgi:hypothetical protein